MYHMIKVILFLSMLNLNLYPLRRLPSNQLLPCWMQILKQKSTLCRVLKFQSLTNLSLRKGPEQNLHSDSPSRVLEEKYDDDGNDWLKEGDVPTSDNKVTYGSDSSMKESQDWVQLPRTSADATKDSNAVGVDHAGTEPVSSHNPDM
ncbi:BSD domain-containing protein [Actinidia rufa]|uniref:BSD domain-containing protein n=1 Tax=Actinidia rufa TaxID=165716 RepID=A0A7J0FLH9_9ERIC|nr:BSD domain-containing protein [Actinidia rufa]